MSTTSAAAKTAKESRSSGEGKGLRILWRVIRGEGDDQWAVALSLSTSFLFELFAIRYPQHLEVAIARHEFRPTPGAAQAPTQRKDISIAEAASHAAQGAAGCCGGRALRGLRIRHVPLWVLEFHHRDPATKEFGVGGFNGSLGRLRTEVDKCDLLCANCHRLRHAPANGFLSVDQRVQLARDKKTRAIMLMGSVCYSCDRAGPTTLFEFHHWDAREKDFGISADGLSRPWAKILAELEKCVMLCANCHREVHAGVRTIRPTLLGLAEDPAEYRAA
jgi:hypothetical protein